MSDGSRRFTDQEVSLVLRKASEIDEEVGRAASGSGLSLADLRQIAREVGISPEAMDRAVAELDRPRLAGLAGAPLTRKAARAVDGELDQAGLARLMRLVDERVDDAGSVTEALGSVRWTADDRLASTQVTLSPEGGQTRIQVVEKARPRMRRIFHLVPAAWGVVLAGPVLGMLEPSAAMAAAGVALAAAVGMGAGRAAWGLLSARSQARVAGLADALAREAQDAVAAGLVADPAPPGKEGAGALGGGKAPATKD